VHSQQVVQMPAAMAGWPPQGHLGMAVPGQVMQPKVIQRIASGPAVSHPISLMKAATTAAMLSPRLRHVKAEEAQDNSPMVRKAKSEQAPQISGIIKKFEQAMSQQSETTRSSSLLELEEASGGLADVCDLRKARNSPVLAKSPSNSSFRFGSALSRASTMNSMPLTVRSPRSFKEVVRQTSQPSLKATALGHIGGSPRSPRSPSPRSKSKNSVRRSVSANIGLLEGRFGSLSPRFPGHPETIEDSIHSMKSLGESSSELGNSWDEYKHASQRVRALHSQSVRVVTESQRLAPVSADSIEEEDDDDDDAAEVEVVKVRSLRESTRLASRRILPLGGLGADSDGEDSLMADTDLKVVETGVITNEGIPTSPHATQFT